MSRPSEPPPASAPKPVIIQPVGPGQEGARRGVERALEELRRRQGEPAPARRLLVESPAVEWSDWRVAA